MKLACRQPVFLALAVSLGGQQLAAVEIAVDGTTCSLSDAIVAANTDLSAGGCPAGGGADVLQLDGDVELLVAGDPAAGGGPSGLPAITSEVEIRARGGSLVARDPGFGCAPADPDAFRLARVAAGGSLHLVDLVLRNGCIAAAPGDGAFGGAVLVEAGGSLRSTSTNYEFNTVVGVPGSTTPAAGGAIAVLFGTLRVAGGTWANNVATSAGPRGGAIFVHAGSVPEIEGATFSGNQAVPLSQTPWGFSRGGALAFEDTEVGSLAFLRVTDNLAGGPGSGAGGTAEGGGLAVTGGRIEVLRDSYFARNKAEGAHNVLISGAAGHGGGLFNTGHFDTIARVTFDANQALGALGGEGRGGGLDNTGTIGDVIATTFYANEAIGAPGLHVSPSRSYGGGLSNTGTIDHLDNSTFTANVAPLVGGLSPLAIGGGLYTSEGSSTGLQSNLLAGNTADTGPDCAIEGSRTSNGFNLIELPAPSCALGGTGDQSAVNPGILALADNGCGATLPGGACLPTVALPSDSPAVDASWCGSTGADARGAPRPVDLAAPNASGGDGCDAGAFEFGGTPAQVHLVLSIADSIDPVLATSGDGNLRTTLHLANIGSGAATGVVVTPTLTLPTGVTFDGVEASTGSWNGTTWTVSSLASGESAALALVLTAGFGTPGGTDLIQVAAAVTAADQHDGALPSDAEFTSTIAALFVDGFEVGSTNRWSAVAP